MFTVRFENAEVVLRRIRKLPAVMQSEIVKAVRRGLLVTESAVTTKTGVKSRRGRAGVFGRLTSYARADSMHGLDAAIGFRKTSGFPYELSQEFGAKAKAGGAMAIPISNSAKAHSERGQGPRTFGRGLIMLKATSGVYLVEMKKKNKNGKPHYKLVKSIKGRLKFRENAAAEMPHIMQDVVAGAQKGLMAL